MRHTLGCVYGNGILTGRSAVEQLGVADIGRTRLDILGDLFIVLRQATEQSVASANCQAWLA
jgi:hypothetical protein